MEVGWPGLRRRRVVEIGLERIIGVDFSKST
jgi:hypothetical protein